MALSFIGKPISLISHSDVRYRGILAGIDPAASTIQLSNVYSMGTESRRPPDQFIPPVQEPYAYIIFRASEVKDLSVDEPPPQQQRRSVHDDPAVLGASAPMAAAQPYAQNYQMQQGGMPPQSVQAPQQVRQPSYSQQQPSQQPAPAQSQPGSAQAQSPDGGTPTGGPRQGRNGSIYTAKASLETVERALGDLRVSNATANGAPAHRSGGRRGRGGQGQDGNIRMPATDFDFETSNAKFDKAALGPSPRATPKGEGDGADGEENDKEKEDIAYNPKKSFFDSLSSGSNGPQADARGGRGGGRRGGGRNRREEERERNVATFGEPGGVGLMGPGAYVGGWGGYGRRGGRGRRGGHGHGGGDRAAAAAARS